MDRKSLFIVIEGLDGIGKSTVSKRLAEDIEARFPGKVLTTFEPNDDSCAGGYIRRVLKKEITRFSNLTLALAFAANRLDHCDRRIGPWLGQAGNIVLCDRYYLSSLVYQTDDQFSKKDIMRINAQAIKPDVILFLDAPNEVALARMKARDQAPELYENNLTATRKKYHKAIRFLEKTREEKIIHIDVSGTVDDNVAKLKAEIQKAAPWLDVVSKVVE